MSISWEINEDGSVTATCDVCGSWMPMENLPGFSLEVSPSERAQFARLMDDLVHVGIPCHGLMTPAAG